VNREDRARTQSGTARHRIEIKLSPEQKDLIERGALATGKSLSEFVRECAEQAARDALRGRDEQS
jgi:uncharacterized protein (DUF1778 family)